jgi:hypothetical protein
VQLRGASALERAVQKVGCPLRQYAKWADLRKGQRVNTAKRINAPLVLLAAWATACSHDDAGAKEGTPAHDSGSPQADAGGGAASGEDGASGTAPIALPCEVQSFLDTHCASCHNGAPERAPMGLHSRSDLLVEAISDQARTTGELSVARLMDTKAPMPPGNPLPSEVTAPFVAWVQAGMPAGRCEEDAGAAVLPFEAVAPQSALAKVKRLLTGLSPTAEELARFTDDPSILPALIDGFMAEPSFEPSLLAFFKTAFQQKELLPSSLTDQLGIRRLLGDPATVARLIDNLEQSFARTALGIVREGRPFTEVATTRRFELTTALASLYLLLDERHLDDALKLQQPGPAFDVRTEGAPIAFADSIDPKSQNYLHFSALGATNGCATTTRASKQDADLFLLLLGATPRVTGCNPSITAPIFTESDFADFRPFEVATLGAGATRTTFYDLPALRDTSELALSTARAGFFTTPAFFANWPTNEDNQLRVTTNQTLIVALGKSFDGTDTTEPPTHDGLSADHAQPGTACYACHRTLDPMRMYFRQSFSFGYHDQRDPRVISQSASFALSGFTARGKGVEGLGAALAAHPRFAKAWVERLCYYANSSACADDDPEVLRIAQAFEAANFDFKTLIRELFASPLVTHLKNTRTSELAEPTVSIARREHFCAALSLRLGLNDACGLGLGPLSAKQKIAEVVATSMPNDAYSRGADAPVTLSDTSLFFRGASENLCAIVASDVVDVNASSPFRHTLIEPAITRLVGGIMGLPKGDARAAEAAQILRSHYDDALAAGSTPTTALRSTFVLACTSPSSVAIGL